MNQHLQQQISNDHVKDSVISSIHKFVHKIDNMIYILRMRNDVYQEHTDNY